MTIRSMLSVVSMIQFIFKSSIYELNAALLATTTYNCVIE